MAALAGVAVALGPAPYPEGEVEFESYEVEEGTVRPGEKTVYRFEWNGINAAEITAGVTEDPGDENRICVSAGGKIIGFPSLLYRAKDSARSCMHKKDLKPGSYSISVRETLTKYDMEVNFDHEAKKAYMEKKKKPFGKSEKEFEFKNAYGPLSTAALIRSLPWEPGDVRRFDVVDGSERHLLVIEAAGEETITVPAGDYKAIRLQPSVFRMPEKRGKLNAAYWEKQKQKDQERASMIKAFTLWMAKDPPRMFLKARTDVYFGHIDMELVEYQAP